jgi:hypothetical protein
VIFPRQTSEAAESAARVRSEPASGPEPHLCPPRPPRNERRRCAGDDHACRRRSSSTRHQRRRPAARPRAAAGCAPRSWGSVRRRSPFTSTVRAVRPDVRIADNYAGWYSSSPQAPGRNMSGDEVVLDPERSVASVRRWPSLTSEARRRTAGGDETETRGMAQAGGVCASAAARSAWIASAAASRCPSPNRENSFGTVKG